MKMLTMENKFQPAPTYTLPPNANPNPSDQASMDSTAQTGHTGVGDWQEEVYQKEPVMPPQQGQQPQPVGQSHAMVQQSQSQITQLQQHDNHLNQTQSMNLQPSMPSMQPPAATGMLHVSVPSMAHLGVPTTWHSIMNALHPSSNLDSTAENTMNSTIGSLQYSTMVLQQNTINTAQQANINTLSQSGSSALQPNPNHLQQSSTMLHHPHLKQVQLMQTQLKQQFQQQQLIQQQQQKQQQLQQQQQKLPQSLQLQQHHMPQLHQMNEANKLKVRPGTCINPVMFPQHHPSGQHLTYQQQLKMSSTNSLPVPSPQFFQALSPHLYQQSVLNTVPKSGTPTQSASSPIVVPPSPSTPLAPSPLPSDTEKQQPSGISSISNTGNVGLQQIAVGLIQSQSLAIGIPGISPSPLLAELGSQDGNQGGASEILSGKSSATERPLQRLIKVVKSMSPNALSYSVGDIGSVVTMVDRIAGLPSGLPPVLSSVSGLNQNAISNVVSQGSNLQTMPGISQNSMTSSVGQGVQSHMFANIQRQMPGKPQQVVPQQHQQQSQNSLQLICEQLQHQLSKQKMQQGNIQPNILPLHMLRQQPPLLQPNHMHYLLFYLFLIIFLIYYLYCF